MTALLTAARAYAERGWPVIPLHHPVLFGPKKLTEAGHAMCSCRRPDCESQGKHPRTENGLDDASTDPEIIRGWWGRWPDANVGLLTGEAFDVLDLDGPDALDGLDNLGPTDGADPIIGPMVITGNGIHIYTEPTGAGNRTGMAPGVDWRGQSGYVVAPPSIHYRNGDRYTWGDLYGLDLALAKIPRWLDDVVHKRTTRATTALTAPLANGATRYGERALESELGRLATVAEGGRNDALNASSYSLGRLVAGGQLVSRQAAETLLIVALRIGLSEHEAVATIASGMESGMRSPRRPEARR